MTDWVKYCPMAFYPDHCSRDCRDCRSAAQEAAGGDSASTEDERLEASAWRPGP